MSNTTTTVGAPPTSNRRAFTPSARILPPPLSLLGIAIPFVVSLVCAYTDLSILFLPWVAFLLGVASGAVLRSWWSLLVAPLACALGTVPSIISIYHGLPDITATGFVASVNLFVLLDLVQVMIGAALAVPLGRELEGLKIVHLRSQGSRSGAIP